MADSEDIAIVHFIGAGEKSSTVSIPAADGKQLQLAMLDGTAYAVEVHRAHTGARIVVRVAAVAFVEFATEKPIPAARPYPVSHSHPSP